MSINPRCVDKSHGHERDLQFANWKASLRARDDTRFRSTSHDLASPHHQGGFFSTCICKIRFITVDPHLRRFESRRSVRDFSFGLVTLTAN